METLTLQRVPFSKDADNRLRSLKAKMGITPNVICRLGFCASLNMHTPPPAVDHSEHGRDISRYTLFGQFEEAYASLLTQWKHDTKCAISMDELCIRHMNRGVFLM